MLDQSQWKIHSIFPIVAESLLSVRLVSLLCNGFSFLFAVFEHFDTFSLCLQHDVVISLKYLLLLPSLFNFSETTLPCNSVLLDGNLESVFIAAQFSISEVM